MTPTSTLAPIGQTWFPDAADRIIEVAPPDTSTFELLAAHGCHRYLGLVVAGTGFLPPDGLAADAARFVPMQRAGEARDNNADVLILNDRFARALWYRRLGHAHHVAYPAEGGSAREAALANRLHRRPPPVRVRWGSRDFDVVELAVDEHPQARHYLSPVVGVEALPRLLDERGVRYVVLRWFDQLPKLDEGEDLDVLVADDDLEAFVEVLEQEPGTIPVDVYSASGRPGSDFRTMAYYPPALANSVLQRAVRLPSGFSVPAPADHFATLAYHAVYHKGAASGLPTAIATPAGAGPDHDYGAVLRELGAEHGYTGPVTLEGLEEHLAAIGWRPPRDMLARLSHHNPWVRARFFADAVTQFEPPLLAAFLLRERASDDTAVALAREVLARHGLEVLIVHRLDETARAACTAEIRGGNWGQGPFPTSGGGPAVVLVAVDDRPKRPSPAQHREHPGLANAHTLEAKLDLRDRLLAGVPAGQQFNPLHSSDNDEDAWHYLELAHPGYVAEARELVEQRRAALAAGEGAGTDDERDGDGALSRATTAARSLAGRVVRKARHIAGEAARGLVARRAATGAPRALRDSR